MKNQKNNQTKECPSLRAMSLFVDNELQEEQARDLIAHLEICPSCAGQIEQLQTMGRSFDLFAQEYADRSRPVPIAMEDAIAGPIPDRVRTLFDFLTPPVLKLVSVTALVLVMAVSVFQIYSGSPPGPGQDAAPSAAPSAIVKTVDTESSSVMILETEKEKHTIIWFSEA